MTSQSEAKINITENLITLQLFNSPDCFNIKRF